jgi:hypothetical protein
MSHFSVLVLTNGCPSDDELSAIMQPFHEFECTGTDDQYVQNLDITEETRREYEAESETRYRDTEGKLHDPYENRFYREPTAEEISKIGPIAGTGCGHGMSWCSRDWGDEHGYRTKIHFLPEGWEEIKVMTRDVETFIEWIEGWHGYKAVAHGEKPGDEHKHGYLQLDIAGEPRTVIKRTNPNSKWDCWCVGGRYSGKFASVDPRKDPRNQQTCFICQGAGKRDDDLGRAHRLTNPDYTCNGCDGAGRELKCASLWVQDGNQVCLDHVDFDFLKRKAVREREDWVAEIKSKSGCSEADVATACELEPFAQEEWRALPEPKPRGKEYYDWLRAKGGKYEVLARVKAPVFDLPDLKKDQTLAAWIADAPALTTFALIKQGEWCERGKMGWWACVSDEKEADNWQRQVNKLLEERAPGTWVTVVDCHI